jgi:hypothetical protein
LVPAPLNQHQTTRTPRWLIPQILLRGGAQIRDRDPLLENPEVRKAAAAVSAGKKNVPTTTTAPTTGTKTEAASSAATAIALPAVTAIETVSAARKTTDTETATETTDTNPIATEIEIAKETARALPAVIAIAKREIVTTRAGHHEGTGPPRKRNRPPVLRPRSLAAVAAGRK